MDQLNQSVSLLGRRLRQERERLGLNQAEFGSHGGVTLKTQGLYERGKRKPDIEYLSKITEAGADLLYILTGSSIEDLVRTFRQEDGENIVSDDELTLLKIWHNANEEQQDAALAVLRMHVKDRNKL